MQKLQDFITHHFQLPQLPEPVTKTRQPLPFGNYLQSCIDRLLKKSIPVDHTNTHSIGPGSLHTKQVHHTSIPRGPPVHFWVFTACVGPQVGGSPVWDQLPYSYDHQPPRFLLYHVFLRPSKREPGALFHTNEINHGTLLFSKSQSNDLMRNVGVIILHRTLFLPS